MKNYDESMEVTYNQNWRYITDNPYRILKLIAQYQARIMFY